MAIIRAKNLSKSFDGGKTYAIKNLTVEIKQGELVAVIGLSGAGKSTFLRALNGTTKDFEGELEVLGDKVATLGSNLVKLRRRIGFIFQNFNLVKSLSVLQNVLVGRVGYAPLWRVLTGFYGAEDQALAKKAIDSVGLEGRYHEKVRNLSGGQQQRVAIARALVQNPELILADEPMASLDPKLSELVLQMLERINRERGITVLVNIHMLELAKKYAHRMLAFREGHIIFDGKPSELSPAKIEEIYRVADRSEGHF
ncbi:MAG: phosphonate ABC transporter ATP-binding protein [Bdellovibrionota bacterium]